MVGTKSDLAQRVHALTFLGIEMKIEDVGQIIRFSQSLLYNLKKKIIEKRNDFTIIFIIHNMHIKYIYKSGKPDIKLRKQLEIMHKVIPN